MAWPFLLAACTATESEPYEHAVITIRDASVMTSLLGNEEAPCPPDMSFDVEVNGERLKQTSFGGQGRDSGDTVYDFCLPGTHSSDQLSLESGQILCAPNKQRRNT